VYDFLEGRVELHAATRLVLEVGGVGYELSVPLGSSFTGARARVWTHLAVREDAHTLYGFRDAATRELFRALLTVNGVGPRTALGVLSGLGVADLAQAITLQEAGRLVKVPGIGKKTAERLLLELKGKLGADIGPHAAVANDHQADILQALLALGYSDREAAAALKALPPDMGVSDGIKLALRSLSKA
jgi:Holliday junction DNA helicase RuvA